MNSRLVISCQKDYCRFICIFIIIDQIFKHLIWIFDKTEVISQIRCICILYYNSFIIEIIKWYIIRTMVLNRHCITEIRCVCRFSLLFIIMCDIVVGTLVRRIISHFYKRDYHICIIIKLIKSKQRICLVSVIVSRLLKMGCWISCVSFTLQFSYQRWHCMPQI